MATDTNGIRKSAILLLSLEQDQAAEVLKRLPPEAQEEVAREIASLGEIPVLTRREVFGEFYSLALANSYLTEGGLEYAKTLLRKSLSGPLAIGHVADRHEPSRLALPIRVDHAQLGRDRLAVGSHHLDFGRLARYGGEAEVRADEIRRRAAEQRFRRRIREANAPVEAHEHDAVGHSFDDRTKSIGLLAYGASPSSHRSLRRGHKPDLYKLHAPFGCLSARRADSRSSPLVATGRRRGTFFAPDVSPGATRAAGAHAREAREEFWQRTF